MSKTFLKGSNQHKIFIEVSVFQGIKNRKIACINIPERTLAREGDKLELREFEILDGKETGNVLSVDVIHAFSQKKRDGSGYEIVCYIF